jgi:phenylacetate-coenzyme A ligase PaaK-like adenylate-forming protein
VAKAWDRHDPASLQKLQDRLVREQVQHTIAPFSPFWKARFAELGRSPSSVKDAAALASIPAVGERDVSPNGDPAGLAALVVQVTEGGFTLHAKGPVLRRALRLRLTHRDDYRRLVESDTKPTSYVWSGVGLRYPVASTRADLDAIARAGARLWSVLGLRADDALLSAVPVGATTEHVALSYAAVAAGAPALFPGDRTADVVEAARLAAPTVVAVPSATAGEVLTTMHDAETLYRARTVLLVGAPTPDQRAAAEAAVARDVNVRVVHAPPGARVLWAECQAAGADGGLHTYPDLELVQLVDPTTGEANTSGGEVVLTQLGLRGSALFRWRTGDVTPAAVDTSRCACGRVVPRLHDVRRGALSFPVGAGRTLDLRAVAGALAGRTDVTDWRLLLGPRGRDGQEQAVLHLVPDGDAAEVAVGVASDIRSLAGRLPTQLVVTTEAALSGLPGERIADRILKR